MRISLFAFITLASAAPSLLPRQADYGYWDATVATDGGAPGWYTRDVTATYYNPSLSSPISKSCHYSFVPQGGAPPAETSTCDEGFSYTSGTPYYTLNLTQTVELGGQQITLYGSKTLNMKCGFGAGNACRAEGRIEASNASS